MNGRFGHLLLVTRANVSLRHRLKYTISEIFFSIAIEIRGLIPINADTSSY